MVVVSNHCFLPVFPAGNGEYDAIIQVEEGRLSSIEKVFRTIFANHPAPHSRLPLGSTVLIGSLSHLGRSGLDSYAGDLWDHFLNDGCDRWVGGGGVVMIPYAQVPLGGVDDPATK